MSDVPEGYRMSEVGVIPEGWEVKRLGDAADVVMGQSPVGTSYNRSGTGAPLINGPTEFTEKYPVKIQWTSQPTKFCKKGDVLLCVRGSSTGRINISDDEYCIGRGVAAIRAKSCADTSFITFQVDSAVKSILALTTGSTFPNIDGKSIRAIQFPFPPLPEQQAIASALSDVDALIAALEQLITKKRNIKQGAMQQLITDKKRLPGFGGEWKVVPFKEIFKKHSTNNYQIKSSEYQQSGTYPIIDQGKQKVVAYSDNKEKLFRCPTNGVIIFGDHTREFKFINFNFVIGADGTQVLSTGEEFSEMFYYYQLLNKEIPNMGYNRHFKFLLEMFFITPKLPEQQAIAQILSDMDAEVESLEQKRDKYKAIKQGMMQELLTGKTRLAKEDKT